MMSLAFISWATFVIVTAVLVIGLVLITTGVTRPDSQARRALSEKMSRTRDAGGEPPASTSRIAAMIGAVGLAAMFIGVGYWMLFRLFSADSGTTVSIEIADDIWKYFLAGSALFIPYAFNSLKSIFIPGDQPPAAQEQQAPQVPERAKEQSAG